MRFIDMKDYNAVATLYWWTVALLGAIASQGREVEDVDVRGPSLQAVFIHLTGRELRE